MPFRNIFGGDQTIKHRTDGRDLEFKAQDYKGIVVGVEKGVSNQRLDKSDLIKLIDQLRNKFPNHYTLIDAILLTGLPCERVGDQYRIGANSNKFTIHSTSDVDKSTAFNQVLEEAFRQLCKIIAKEMIRDTNIRSPRRKDFRSKFLTTLQKGGECRNLNAENMTSNQIEELEKKLAHYLDLCVNGQSQGLDNIIAVVNEELKKEMDKTTQLTRQEDKNYLLNPVESRLKEPTGFAKALKVLKNAVNPSTPAPSYGSASRRSSGGRIYSDKDLMVTHGLSALSAKKFGASDLDIKTGGAFTEDYIKDGSCTGDSDAF